jgi:hypothetical protein
LFLAYIPAKLSAINLIINMDISRANDLTERAHEKIENRFGGGDF